MQRTSIIMLIMAVILASAGCGASDTPETAIVGGADEPTSIILSNEASKGLDTEESDDLIAEEQALSAVKNYCSVNNPDLSDIESEGEYPVYWEIESKDENEIVVLFRSYTGALIRYHIDPVSGDTHVTEYVPGITPKDEKTDEQFNIRDYIAVNADRLKNLYPEFFDNDKPTAKGIEVYVWQMAENSFSCGLMYGTNREKTDEETWSLQNRSISINEAKAILHATGVSKEEIIVIPIHQHYSSYMYRIDEDYREHIAKLFL